MEEKKEKKSPVKGQEKKSDNRRRPTVKDINALQDALHAQCEDAKAWRKKYVSLDAKYHDLLNERNALDKSVKILEARCEDLKNIRKANAVLSNENERLLMEMEGMKQRGFWKRLFNR